MTIFKKLKDLFNRKAAPPVWQNWSGRLNCNAEIIEPKTTLELAEALKNAKGPIRPVGSGHSFSELIPTDGTIITLKHFTGILDHDAKTLEATIGAGSVLHDIGDPLYNLGQAFKNMGDIDKQTLAGAISTSTHGTGAALQSYSACITGLELVTAAGDILWCDKDHNADVFKAAQVSLGSLGVVTKVRMQNTEPYMLERRAWVQPLEETLNNFDKLAAENRNIEFYYIPYSDMAAVITMNKAPEGAKVERMPEQTDPLKSLQLAKRLLGWSKGLHRKVLNHELRKIKPEHEIDWSHKLYPSDRESMKFNEMEYHLPRENGPACLREIRAAIEKNKIDVFFPIEFRTVAADDVWLSPFSGRDTCSIAVHQVASKDAKPYFDIIEPILKKHGGRPHWGKQHTLTAADFAKLYPHWNDFLKVRERLDPEGKFLNTHLEKALGLKAGAPRPKAKPQPQP
jgi:FAD-linked oxidoreductase